MNKFLVLLMVLLGSLQGALQAHGTEEITLFKEDWVPSTEVIATYNGEPITEIDLYVWMVISQKDALMLPEWKTGRTNAPLSNFLELTIKDYLQAKALFPEASAFDSPQDSLLPREKAAHLLANWPASVSYAEELVRDSVEVSERDLQHAYRINLNRFETPEKISYAKLDVVFGENITVEEGKRRAEIIRNALVSGTPLQQVVEQYKDWLTIESRNKPFFEQQLPANLEPTVLDQLTGLLPGQVSPPVQRARSMRLVQLIARIPKDVLPYVQVREQLRTEVFPTFFKQQFERQIRALLDEGFPLNRVSSLRFMEPEMAMLRLREYELLTSEFLAFAEEFPFPNAPTDRKEKLRHTAREILRAEAMHQALKQQGLLEQSFYPIAVEQAHWWIARKRLLEAPVGEVSESELTQYISENRAMLFPFEDYTIWSFSARIPETFRGDSVQRAELMKSLSQQQGDMIVRARQLLEERVQIGSPAAYGLPDPVLARLIGASTEPTAFVFQNMGAYTLQEAVTQLGMEPGQLTIGQFTGPREINGEQVSYYVAEKRARPEPTALQLENAARAALNEEKKVGRVQKEIAESIRRGGLKLNWK